MTRRSAVTLIEVLVAIFIMAIGLLALLTLFPLGALTMDQAIRADRAGACAHNAYGIVAAKNIRKDTLFYDPDGTPSIDAYVDPNPPAPAPRPWPVIPKQPGAHRGASYPIVVDPFGVLAANNSQPPLGAWPPPGVPLGAVPASPGMPRRSVSFVAGATTPAQRTQQALRWFSLLDDMEFDGSGLPKVIGSQVQRTNRYTWSLVLRRITSQDREWVEMAVVVYYSRPLQLAGGEPAYAPVVFDPQQNSVLVEWDPATQERPPVRKGSWVLDATIITTAGVVDPHGYFYRVVNVTEVPPRTAGRQALQLELQERPRKATTTGVLVVMEHVTEVFDEGLGWKP